MKRLVGTPRQVQARKKYRKAPRCCSRMNRINMYMICCCWVYTWWYCCCKVATWAVNCERTLLMSPDDSPLPLRAGLLLFSPELLPALLLPLPLVEFLRTISRKLVLSPLWKNPQNKLMKRKRKKKLPFEMWMWKSRLLVNSALLETVKVQLSHKGREVGGSKVVGKNFLSERILLDHNETISRVSPFDEFVSRRIIHHLGKWQRKNFLIPLYFMWNKCIQTLYVFATTSGITDLAAPLRLEEEGSSDSKGCWSAATLVRAELWLLFRDIASISRVSSSAQNTARLSFCSGSKEKERGWRGGEHWCTIA